MSRIGITGVAGFIGSHLAERLVAEGHEVVGVDCFAENYARELKERNLDSLAGEPRFALIEEEMGAPSAGRALQACEIVLHLAATPGVRTSDEEQLWRTNAEGTARLVELLEESDVRRLLLASSSSIYGSSPTPKCEVDQPQPGSMYARSKLAAEQICLRSSLNTVVLRYFTVYGERQRPDMAFAAFINAALDGEPAPFYGTGTQVRNFTYVADVVDATVLGMQHGRNRTVYNVAGSHTVQLATALDEIERCLGRSVPTRTLPPDPRDALSARADTRRARGELGWRANTGLAEGLRAQTDHALECREMGIRGDVGPEVDVV